MHRTLALRKETLAELPAGELGSVVGGSVTVGCPASFTCTVSRLACRVSDVLAECPSVAVC